MLNPSDLVHIPYTPELTLAGILYACRCLALGQVRASNLQLNPLRDLSAEIAADLSLRRYLAAEHIAFKALEAEPFTQPERQEIILGGRPCHVINTSIDRRQQMRRIAASTKAWLSMPACAAEAALNSEKWGYQDLLVFTFTLEASKPVSRNPGYLIFIFPETWRNARLGGKTPGLALQYTGEPEITIDMGGRATNERHVVHSICLPPRQPVTVAEDFSILAYLATQQAPTATISLHNPALNRTLRISPDRWCNLWVDGEEILLAGYIEAGEFRRYARRLRASRHREFASPSQSLYLPVQDLQPLPQLITWLRSWHNTG